MKRSLTTREERRAPIEICILAGGLSARMGRAKAQLKLGRRSMLAIIRETANELRLPIRIIRRDIVPRCGPLGGILTGLQATPAEAVLFLACDMPLISPTLLKRLLRLSRDGTAAVFASQGPRLGFPILLPTSTIAAVERQIVQRRLSIHELATVVRARKLRVPSRSRELFNVNTPGDKAEAERLFRQRTSRTIK